MQKSYTAVGIALCLMMVSCSPGGGSKPSAESSAKVKITDIEVGTGREAKEGDYALVLYRGTLAKDGKQFDTNMDDLESQLPYGFGVGAGQVIKGWDEGIPGMKEGGTRKLEIPWELAYGKDGDGDKIPPKANLNFEVKLLFVMKQDEKGIFDYNDNKVGTGAEAVAGSTVEVHYVGTYLTGKVWDDSRKRGKTVSFVLEKESDAIPGMVAGVTGMKVGGQRTLVLPPSLVFGPYGNANIQGNQPVKIVVDLISVNGKKG